MRNNRDLGTWSPDPNGRNNFLHPTRIKAYDVARDISPDFLAFKAPRRTQEPNFIGLSSIPGKSLVSRRQQQLAPRQNNSLVNDDIKGTQVKSRKPRRGYDNMDYSDVGPKSRHWNFYYPEKPPEAHVTPHQFHYLKKSPSELLQ